MAIQSRTYLKGKYETGDKPVQQDFHDWIDSYFHLTEDASLLDDYVTSFELTSAFDSYVPKIEIIDNLISTDTDKPLSANQGNVLNTSISNLDSSKEDDLGLPAVDGYILSSTTSGTRSWIDPVTISSVEWGNISGSIVNQTDLQTELNTLQTNIDAKENSLGNPLVDGYVLSSTASGVRSWVDVSGGTIDHGELIGLADDDHTQYHNDTRGDARYSQLGHTHLLSEITDYSTPTLQSVTDAGNTTTNDIVFNKSLAYIKNIDSTIGSLILQTSKDGLSFENRIAISGTTDIITFYNVDGLAHMSLPHVGGSVPLVQLYDSTGTASTKIYEDPTFESGTVGSFLINDGITGGYEGFNIGGRAAFIHDNGLTTGLYDDVNQKWFFKANHGASSEIYDNGLKIVETTASAGLSYNADYASGYTDRSLVDKAYADSLATPITELGTDRYELRGDNDGGTLFDIVNEGTTAGTRTLRLSVPNGTTQGEAALEVVFGGMTMYCYADGTMYITGSGTVWFNVADIRMPSLPTSAPAESGRLWNNSNVVNIV